MKVAFISDIHANFTALCQALETADRLGVEKVVAAGDLIGRGPHPVEVIRMLAEREVEAIRGNMDLDVLTLKPRKARKAAKGKGRKWRNLAWTAAQLGKKEWEWLAALPAELNLEFQGNRVRVVHGSPRSVNDYIFPSITAPGLESKLDGERPDVLVCGHSHIPFSKIVGGLRIINCGSAGQPYDGDPRGCFVLAEFGTDGKIHSTIVRFDFAVDDLVNDLAARDVPGIEPKAYRLGIKTLKDLAG